MHVTIMADEPIIRQAKGISFPTEQFKQYDRFTHALTVIDEQHRLAHDGAMFIFSTYFANIPGGGIADFLVCQDPIVPPAHVRQWRVIYNRGPLVLRGFENPVITDPGTPKEGRNQNRNYPDTGGSLKFFEGSVIADPGEELFVQYAPIGLGKTDALGEEWILKRSDEPQYYVLRVQNSGFLPVTMSFDVYWYVPPYEDKAGSVNSAQI